MTPASEDWCWYLRLTLEMAETKNLTDKNNSRPIVCFYKIAIKQPLALPNKHGTNIHLLEVLFNALWHLTPHVTRQAPKQEPHITQPLTQTWKAIGKVCHYDHMLLKRHQCIGTTGWAGTPQNICSSLKTPISELTFLLERRDPHVPELPSFIPSSKLFLSRLVSVWLHYRYTRCQPLHQMLLLFLKKYYQNPRMCLVYITEGVSLLRHMYDLQKTSRWHQKVKIIASFQVAGNERMYVYWGKMHIT